MEYQENGSPHRGACPSVGDKAQTPKEFPDLRLHKQTERGEMMTTSWEDYLGAPATWPTLAECRAVCAAIFEPVRQIFEHVIAAQRPGTIACLGAGVLNDIPFNDFVQSGADIHLVDWIPGIVDIGLAQSCTDRDAAGNPRCAFCALDSETARMWCRRFAGTPTAGRGVCRNFEPVGRTTPVCKSYERGERPFVHYQDVTGGYASAFARGRLRPRRPPPRGGRRSSRLTAPPGASGIAASLSKFPRAASIW